MDESKDISKSNEKDLKEKIQETEIF